MYKKWHQRKYDSFISTHTTMYSLTGPDESKSLGPGSVPIMKLNVMKIQLQIWAYPRHVVCTKSTLNLQIETTLVWYTAPYIIDYTIRPGTWKAGRL